MNKKLKIMSVALIAGVVVAAGCSKKSDSQMSEKKGVGERTGAAMDRAAEKTGEAAGKVVDKTGEVIEKTGAAIEKTGAKMQD